MYNYNYKALTNVPKQRRRSGKLHWQATNDLHTTRAEIMIKVMCYVRVCVYVCVPPLGCDALMRMRFVPEVFCLLNLSPNQHFFNYLFRYIVVIVIIVVFGNLCNQSATPNFCRSLTAELYNQNKPYSVALMIDRLRYRTLQRFNCFLPCHKLRNYLIIEFAGRPKVFTTQNALLAFCEVVLSNAISRNANLHAHICR